MKSYGVVLMGLMVMASYCFCQEAVSSAIQEPADIVDESPVVSSSKRSDNSNYALYMRACYLHKKGEANEAFQAYKNILDKPHPLYVYDGFIRLLFDTGQFGTLINLVHQKKAEFEKQFKDNVDINIMLAQSFLFAGQHDEAEKRFLQLSREHKDNDLVAYYTAVALMRKNDPQKILSFLEERLNRPGLKNKHFLFHFLASKVYLQMQKPEEAQTSIDKSLKLFPQFDQGLLFKAMLFEQQGKINEAIKGYEQFLDVVGQETEIEKQLIQLLFSQQRFGEAAERLKRMGGESCEYYFDLALLELNARRPQQALEHIAASLKLSPDFAKAKLLQLEILLTLRKHEQALALVQQWLVNDPENLAVVHVVMLLKKAKIPLDRLIKLGENVLAKKESALLHAAVADLYLEKRQHVQSKKHYEKGLALSKDDALKKKLSYQVAYTSLKLNQFDGAKKILEELVKDGASPVVCNLLTYVYAQSSSNLSEALTLIDKALVAYPNRADFLDTKGFILMKMNKKDEALVFIKKALALNPKSPGIQKRLEELGGK